MIKLKKRSHHHEGVYFKRFTFSLACTLLFLRDSTARDALTSSQSGLWQQTVAPEAPFQVPSLAAPRLSPLSKKGAVQLDWWLGWMGKRVDQNQGRGYFPFTSDLHLFAPFLSLGPGELFLQLNTLPTFLREEKNILQRNFGFFPNAHGGLGFKSQAAAPFRWMLQGGLDLSPTLAKQEEGRHCLSRWGGEGELGGQRLWAHGFYFRHASKKGLQLANSYGVGLQAFLSPTWLAGLRAYCHPEDSVQLATRMNEQLQLQFRRPWGGELSFRCRLARMVDLKGALGFESFSAPLNQTGKAFWHYPYGLVSFSFHPFASESSERLLIPLSMKPAFLATVLQPDPNSSEGEDGHPEPEIFWIEESRPVGSWSDKIRLGLSAEGKSAQQASGITGVRHRLWGGNHGWPLSPENGVEETVEKTEQSQQISFLLDNGKDAYFQAAYQGTAASSLLVAPLIIKETETAGEEPATSLTTVDCIPLYPGNAVPWLKAEGLSLTFERKLTWSPVEASSGEGGFQALFSFVGPNGVVPEITAPISLAVWPKQPVNAQELEQYSKLVLQLNQDTSNPQAFSARLSANKEAEAFLLSTLFQISYGTESGEPLCFEWTPRSFTQSLSPSAVYTDPLLVAVSAEEKAAAVEEGVVGFTLRFLESDASSFHRFIASPITKEGCTEEAEEKFATPNLALPSEARYLGLCPALESTPTLPFALAPQVAYQRSYREEAKEDEIEILAFYPGNGQELVQEKQMSWTFEQEASEIHPVAPEEMVYHTASGEALSDYLIAGKAVFHCTLAEGSSLPEAPLTLHIQKEGEEARMVLSNYQTSYGGRKYLLTGWDPETQQLVLYLYKKGTPVDLTEAYQLYMEAPQGGAQALSFFSFVPWILWIEEKRPVGRWSEKMRLGLSAEEKTAQQSSDITGVRYRLWGAHDRWPLEPENGVEETVEKSGPWQQIRFQLENEKDAYFQAAYQGSAPSPLLIAPLLIKETEQSGEASVRTDWIPLYPGNTLAWLRKEGVALQFEAGLTWSPVEASSEEWGFQALFSFVSGSEALPEITAPISLALWPKGSVNAQALEQYGALVFQLNQDASNPEKFSARLPANKEVEAFLLSTLFQISYGTESGEPLCFEWAPRSFTQSLSPSSVYTDPLLVTISAEEKKAAVEEGVAGITLRFLESDAAPSFHRFIASPLTEEGCTEEAEDKIASLNLASPSEAHYLGLCSALEPTPRLPFALAPQVVYQRSYGEEGKEDEIEILALYPGNGQAMVKEKQISWTCKKATAENHRVTPEEAVYRTASGEALSDYPIAGKAVFHYTLAEGSSLPEAPLTLHIQKEGEHERMTLSSYQTSYEGRKYLLTGWDPGAQQVVLYVYKKGGSVSLTETYDLYMESPQGGAPALTRFAFVDPWLVIDHEGKYIQFERILPPKEVKTLFVGYPNLIAEARAKDSKVPFKEGVQTIQSPLLNDQKTLSESNLILINALLGNLSDSSHFNNLFQCNAKFTGIGDDKNHYQSTFSLANGITRIAILNLEGPHSEGFAEYKFLTEMDMAEEEHFVLYKVKILAQIFGYLSKVNASQASFFKDRVALPPLADLSTTAEAYHRIENKYFDDNSPDARGCGKSLMVPCEGPELLCIHGSENVSFLSTTPIQFWGTGVVFYGAITIQ